MTAQQRQFEHFYDSQAYGHRQLNTQQLILDRYAQPGFAVTAIFLLVTILWSLYGSTLAPEGLLVFIGDSLWDLFVFIVPTPLVNALDQQKKPPSLYPSPMPVAQANGHAAKSAVLQRVLGIDRSGGVMASVLQVRSRALSATGSAFGLKLDDRPPGLGNRDNSCYQNSILQGLASLEPFPGYLASSLQSINGEEGNTEVAQTLRALILDLNDVTNNGRTLWTPSILKSMSTWTQQDAQEYYSKILDDIDKGVAKAMAASRRHKGFESEKSEDARTGSQYSDDSGYQSGRQTHHGSDAKAPRNPLEGLLAQRVSCVTCGHSDGLSMIPFNCLTLSLDLDRTHYTLHDRLNAYSKLEKIEGVECPRCTLLKAKRLLTRLVDMMKEKGTSAEQMGEPLQRLTAVETALEEDDFDEKTIKEKCKISSQAKVTTTKTKQIVVARPPQSLAIHMNRSVFNPATFDMIKNSAPVRFPKTLDLGPWCLGSADLSSTAMTEKISRGEEEWQLDPESSMVAGSSTKSRLSGPIYELRAAVTHNGRHENGHYICYRRFPRNLTPSTLRDEKPQHQEGSPGGNVEADTDDVPDDDTSAEATTTEKEIVTEEEEMEWWRLSDHNVSRVDEDVVMSLSPGVFMLFYDCIDANMVHCEGAQDEDEDAANVAQNGEVTASTGTVEELRNELRASPLGQGKKIPEPVLLAEGA